MAIAELGKKFPVREEGVKIPLDDDVSLMQAGEVMEQVLEVDGTLNREATKELIHQILFMKKDYPQFVLHYLKVESSRITVQFAIAPPGAIISGAGGAISGDSDETRIAAGVPVTAIYIIAALVLAIITAAILLTCAIKEIWLFAPKPKTGSASVVARNQKTGAPIPNVNVSVAGQTKKTGPNGEAVLFEDLVIGDHIFVGAAVAGYQSPQPVTATVKYNEQILVTILYAPEGWVPPTTGHLAVSTSPVNGEVFLQGKSYGKAPVFIEDIEAGEYKVAFGAIQGYETPAQQTVTIRGGWTEGIVAYYKTPDAAWWEKYIRYGLIGGGVIIGAAVLIPEIMRAGIRRGEKE